MNSKIKVVIVDDHELYREAAVMMLSQADDILITGVCKSGEEVIQHVKKDPPDVVLMDINMEPVDGFEATKVIKELFPSVKVLAYSAYDDPYYVKKMIKMGASGYVTKTSHKFEFIDAITKVYNGEEYICSEVKQKMK